MHLGLRSPPNPPPPNPNPNQARAEEEAVCALRRAFERSPKPVAAEDLRPAGSAAVCGGRARIRDLKKAAALNGQEGVICSFNTDGKRRFCPNPNPNPSPNPNSNPNPTPNPSPYP